MKLVVENLKKKFGLNEVLKGLNFSFEEGKIYALLGRNGAGKTTFFNCLNEDLDIDAGSFYLLEDDVKKKIESEDLGYVLSTPTVPDFLTGREFIKFFIDINRDRIKDVKSIDEYFEMMKIDVKDRDKLLKDYSHGMKNKMQMLANIISDSKILLLDEPLTSLDVVVAEDMKNLLKSIKNNKVLIFSTHIMELALSLCDEIVLLKDGLFEYVDRSNNTDDEIKNKILDALMEE